MSDNTCGTCRHIQGSIGPAHEMGKFPGARYICNNRDGKRDQLRVRRDDVEDCHQPRKEDEDE